MRQDDYWAYWGKAGKPAAPSPLCHLLPCHCLDVAAAGEAIWHRHHGLRQRLVTLLGLPEDTIGRLLRFFLLIHDIGKFADAFQSLRADIAEPLLGYRPRHAYLPDYHHDRLGLGLWRHELSIMVEDEGWIFDPDNGSDPDDWQQALDYWASAFLCHHSRPQPSPEKIELDTRHFSPRDRQAAADWCRAARQLAGDLSLPQIDAAAFEQASQRASWLLAGFAVLADWVGSNTGDGYFTYCDQPQPLADYWQQAQARAERALDDFGLLPAMVDADAGFADLFPAIVEPSPLQLAAGSVTVSAEPSLYIIEDVTGAGKTEAALQLAQRLMASGQAGGLYVGLPTMATSNAMFERLAAQYRRFFTPSAQPSIALAHGARHLSAAFQQIVGDDFQAAAFPQQMADTAADQDDSAAAQCNAWIADNRKKTFFAHVGVGTLDQALLAVLPSRHQSLRLLGLSQQVLLADEVHAYDHYTGGLLEALLTFHAALGGSAILLSATLPTTLRERLARAFRKGLSSLQPLPDLSRTDYPLLTRITADACDEQRVATRPDVAREVEVRALSSHEDAEAVLLAAARHGQCACWIRNTVVDAIDSYRRLAAHPELQDRVELFHARFALGDRLEIERRVLDRFGVKSKPADRRGRILIATQVIEMSVDCDFDVMVSDLAPIDALIQRGGRVHRHRRSTDGDMLPHGQPDQRGAICLHVLMPSPVDEPDANWFKALFPRQALVYDDPAVLWRTARLLTGDRPGWRMPDDARRLIQAVYEPDEAPPAALQAATEKAQGKHYAHSAAAMRARLNIAEGYWDNNGPWSNEVNSVTRIEGEPTMTAWLACWDGEQLRPWRDGEHAWEYSAVSLRASLINGDPSHPPAIARALEALSAQLPVQGKFGRVVVLQRDGDGWAGPVTSSSGQSQWLGYSACEGALIVSEKLAAI